MALTIVACGGGERTSADAFRTEIDTVEGVPHVRNYGDPPRWTLTPLFRIGGVEATDTTEGFGSVRSIGIDAGGSLWIADVSLDVVRRFDADGAYRGMVGRVGAGPGEFENPYAVGFVGDTVAVIDPGNVRVGIFDPSGEWLGQWPYPPLTGSNRVFQTGPSEFWATSLAISEGGAESVFVRYTSSGPVDTLPRGTTPDYPEPRNSIRCEFDGGFSGYTPDLAPRARQAPGPGGVMVESEPVGYRLLFRTGSGDTVRIVERITDEELVTDEEWARAVAEFESFRSEIPGAARCTPEGLERPGRERLIEDIFPDAGGRIWVEHRMDEDSPEATFDVYDPRGTLLGTLTGPTPGPFAAPSARDDRFYVVTLDSLDVPVIHGFRIER